ncbi:MAG: 23S rRNA (pseudouridine(1915)-N(3))-methyltransferase RlmH [Flavobacteriaceae bacterium]|jgi:23S rRNA (pseudouridine1915-N3)-methyltransferase
MKVTLLVIGKTDDKLLRELIDKYHSKLKHYARFNYIEIIDPSRRKSMSVQDQKKQEASKIESLIDKQSRLILLDENGKAFSSRSFASFIENEGLQGNSNLTFVIGGPYGFSEELKIKSHLQMSLSQMTFTHQMVRLIFSEQLYRAFSILKGEPYHHD